MVYFCVKFQNDPQFGVNLTFFAPWLSWQRPPFRIFSTPKSSHTLRWIFLQSFMKFDERNQIFFKSPLFCFHGNCGKVCSTDSEFFGLSRFTGCGCCSYQVLSISVRRVICYDNFCVLIFFQHFGRSHGNDGHFENYRKQSAHLLIVLNIPDKFH